MKSSSRVMPCLAGWSPRIGLKGPAQVLECVIKSGACRADGRPHRLGGFRQHLAQVVHQHDHRPMLKAELPERAIELVLGGDP